jgi:hypothetical protein
MAFNSFLKIFLPKDRVFYELFEKVAFTIEKMGKKLKEVVAEPDFDKRGVLIKLIEDTPTIFLQNWAVTLLHPSTGKIYITWPRRSTILPIIFMLRPKK